MELHERMARAEADIKNLFHQTKELKNEVNDIHKLTTSVELIAKQTVDINKKVDGIDKRLDTVEKAPAEDLKHYKRAIISCIITGVISLILGAIGALIII